MNAIWNDTQIIVKKVHKTSNSIERLENSRARGRSYKKIRVFTFDKQGKNRLGEEAAENLLGFKRKNSSFVKNSRPNTSNQRQNIRGTSLNRFQLKIPPNKETSALLSKFFTPLSIKGSTLHTKPELNSFPKLDSISDYLIGKNLGHGTYSLVKKAVHKQTLKVFALKIYEKSGLSPLQIQNINSEIKTLKLINHPNIVKFHFSFEGPQQILLFFELVNGPLLSEYVRSKPGHRLNEKEACRIFFQLIQAVFYCHSKEIMHRDIKFENILMDKDLNVKVIDFGFACFLRDKGKNLTYCGTPGYMAPEIVLKHSGNGLPADVWACGVVLFGMVCGYLPFNNIKEIDYFMNLTENPLYIPNFVSSGPRELISKMLTINKEKRIQMKEVLDFWWFKEMGYNIEWIKEGAHLGNTPSPTSHKKSSFLSVHNRLKSPKSPSVKRTHSYLK